MAMLAEWPNPVKQPGPYPGPQPPPPTPAEVPQADENPLDSPDEEEGE